MIARVLTGHGTSAQNEDIARWFRDRLVPLAREHKGFVGAYFLAGRDSDKGMAITLWETPEDERAWDSSQASGTLREQRAADHAAHAPTVEVYAVTVQV